MITFVHYSDWVQMFVSGECALEGHSLSARQLLDYLNENPESPIEVEVEDIDMSTLPNNDFQIDNLAFDKNLGAIRAAKEAHDGRDD